MTMFSSKSTQQKLVFSMNIFPEEFELIFIIPVVLFG